LFVDQKERANSCAFKTIPYEYASAMHCRRFFTLLQSFQWLKDGENTTIEAAMGL
jgi:hypothetical protein